MDSGEGGSSKRSGDGGKMKGTWKEAGVAAAQHHVNRLPSSSYCLFPANNRRDKGRVLDVFSLDQPQPQLKMPNLEDTRSSGKVFTPVHPPKMPHTKGAATSSKKAPTCLELLLGEKVYDVATVFPDGIHSCCSHTVNLKGSNAQGTSAGLNVQGQMSNHESIVVPVSSGGSGSLQLSTLNDLSSSYFPYTAPGVSRLDVLAHLLSVEKADRDQRTPQELLVQSVDALMNHYDRDVLMLYSRGNPANANANAVVTLEPRRIISGGPYSSQLLQQQMMRSTPPVNTTLGLIHIKGNVAAFCCNEFGSRFIQQALEAATPEEILMVYEEIMPCVRTLAIDIFANHALQKLLDKGPQFYKRKVISHLIGHVLALSLHMYGCRVVQKVFEIADVDQKIAMAQEFGGKVLKCARAQFANHVIQKCMECVPAQHIQFIFRSFCGKAKALSFHTYGCHVIQKVLSFCDNPEIYRTLILEIVEDAPKLSVDQCGNYVVQHILQHGGPMERSIIVKKFAGRVVGMSYDKFACNVIEKCLTFGSRQDRQLITNEILSAGGGQRYDHLLDMMVHLYANFVVKTMLVTAEDWQRALLVKVARRNVGTLSRHPNGRHIVAAVQQFLSTRALHSHVVV
ncbi:pumilio homolog 3-like [Phragmites australis]|uniref:pumilio homolog 3-like n=1 Tax=Phragmites australis TaxID=29695 RepID=UPI002D79F9C2|nr:pumilio homolog 3-like [Phragmites australis]